jgi:hypothetical protein
MDCLWGRVESNSCHSFDSHLTHTVIASQMREDFRNITTQ